MSRKGAAQSLTLFEEGDHRMEFQAKLFTWQDTGNHLIILARGAMNGPGFSQLFSKIHAETEGLNECKVLVDLSDSTCGIDGEKIEKLVAGLSLSGWPTGNKLAFVSASEIANYHRLYFLRTALVGRGVVVEVFRTTKVALDWLAGRL
jgi:hypothetical protein